MGRGLPTPAGRRAESHQPKVQLGGSSHQPPPPAASRGRCIFAHGKPRRDGRAITDGWFLTLRPLVLLLTHRLCSWGTSRPLARGCFPRRGARADAAEEHGAAAQQFVSENGQQPHTPGTRCWEGRAEDPRAAGSVPRSLPSLQRGHHQAVPGCEEPAPTASRASDPNTINK